MVMWAQPLPWTPAAPTYFRAAEPLGGLKPRPCPEVTQEAGEGPGVAMEWHVDDVSRDTVM